MASISSEQEFSNADHYHILGATVSITADSDTTDGEHLVFDMLVPELFEIGLHTHEQSVVYHIIEGELRLHVDGEDHNLSPGMTGHIPGGTHYGFANAGDSPCRVIAVWTPGGAEGFFREIGEPSENRSLPEPVEPTEEMLQSLSAAGKNHGFEFMGPLPEPTN